MEAFLTISLSFVENALIKTLGTRSLCLFSSEIRARNMQVYPYGLIAFGLCVAVASSATVIISFDAKVDIGDFGVQETAFATNVE
jgi:hypothetical protein